MDKLPPILDETGLTEGIKNLATSYYDTLSQFNRAGETVKRFSFQKVKGMDWKHAVKKLLESIDGIAAVLEPSELELDHDRSGELIALSEEDAWFCYYYWLNDERAPDFARTVDIHRKPGYDPCELFMTSLARAGLRLAQKKLGMRYKMDVVPLDPSLVRGSHGLRPAPEHGAAIVGPEAPSCMQGFKAYLEKLLAS